MKDIIAQASISIDATPDEVWDALTNPDLIRRYMFGTTVKTSWAAGDPITWKGEWKGKPYEDRGKILRVDRGRRIEYTHFSPLMGKPDVPESYHTVTIELVRDGSDTLVTLSQDNNETDEARQHSEDNWRTILEGLKKVVEE